VKRFGEVIALNHIDLDIAAGELFFLPGPSGCGKTTLLRAIDGFNLPDEGKIHFDEDDVTNLPARNLLFHPFLNLVTLGPGKEGVQQAL